ncbi:N-formylglutamate amidohydrolase [Streptomyces sp. WG-D5]
MDNAVTSDTSVRDGAGTPPFRLHPGDPSSPVLLHVPHASRVIPGRVREGLLLHGEALERELDLITDAHTDVVAERAARAARRTPWRFVNGRSRLVVDPERFPDEREEMRAVGMGAVYTRTTRREPLRVEPAADEEELLDTYFRPYARAVAGAVGERLDAVGRAVIIDVHSYPSRALPYELHGGGVRPPVCLGVDSFHTPGALVERAREVFAPVGGVEVNTPFAGAYVPLERYGCDGRVLALMVEVRRDVYLTEPVAPHGGLDVVASALAELVDAVPELLR